MKSFFGIVHSFNFRWMLIRNIFSIGQKVTFAKRNKIWSLEYPVDLFKVFTYIWVCLMLHHRSNKWNLILIMFWWQKKEYQWVWCISWQYIMRHQQRISANFVKILVKFKLAKKCERVDPLRLSYNLEMCH